MKPAPDIVVVGAGPAGILAYEQLNAAGFDVMLIDAGPAGRPGAPAPPSPAAVWGYRTSDGAAVDWPRVHAVGGRTLGWGGFCHRFPPVVFQEGGWPYGAPALRSAYAAAERWLGVAEGLVSPTHRAAARRLGLPVLPLRGARTGQQVWTARHASGARAAVTGQVATMLACDGRRATGLHLASAGNGMDHVSARSFVLAAGAIETTRILLASGLGTTAPRLGRGLVHHPTATAMLVEPLVVAPAPAPPLLQGALIPRFVNLDAASRRPYEGGFSIEITGPRPLHALDPAIARGLGMTPAEARRLQLTVINGIGEARPDEGRFVCLSTNETDALGRCLPILNLAVSPQEERLAAEMTACCMALADAMAGPDAELVLPPTCVQGRRLFHEAGTCAMGVSAGSVCDPWGRLRALDNVWVADASVFPSAGDRHPTLTLLAHVMRVSRSVRRQSGRA